MDLSEFLMARIVEDEAVARAATPGPWIPDGQGWRDAQGEPFIQAPYHELDIKPEDEAHVTRWQPGRVLAECEAKRRIVESVDVLTGGDKTYAQRMRHSDAEDARYVIARDILLHLTLPYADHLDYREEWRP